ncbi:MAG: glycosyltransferase, partial [Pseudomonadota bacterium]
MSGVSAIVVTYHTGPRLKECLYALSADPEISETIIVDNGNPADTQDWLKTFCEARPRSKMLSEHGNIGFGAGVNRGVDAAIGEHILVINPDAVLRRGSVASLQEASRDCAEPWIIGGKIFDLFGVETRGPRRRELTLWRAATSILGWNTWTLETTSPPPQAIEMPVISGAFF